MKALQNFPIGMRLTAAFALLLLAMGVAVGAGLWAMQQMQARTKVLVDQDYRTVAEATRALDNVRGSIARVFQLTGDTEADRLKEAGKRLQANLDAVDAALAEVARQPLTPKVHDALARATAARERYVASVGRVRQALAGDRAAAAAMAYGEAYPALHALAKELRALLDEADNALDDAVTANEAGFRRSAGTLLTGTALTLALGLALAWAITRSITQPLRRAVALADRVSVGDLTSEVSVHGRDETAHLLESLSRMQQALVDIVGQVRQASDSIATGSAQIASGSADLSRRAESQAANLEQTAASMEQLTAVVRQSAETAAEASRLAEEASHGAVGGGQSMQRVIDTMQVIGDRSARVQEIVSVIDGIAFQTNILALNAAVEAARAGEHGRGFAVVATEVRLLAQRAGDAAREIRTLVGQSAETVSEGGRLVGETGGAIEAVVAQVTRVGQMIRSLGQSGAEQRSGIEQVGTAVEQLDQTTQQNAALAEQSAAAAESLRVQAERLSDSVARFRLAP